MTKRSLKGTAISARSGLTRDANASIWLSDTTPDSAKDNPLNLTVVQDIIAANIKAMVDGGLVQLTDSTNDCVAFAPSSVISFGGSIYTVDEVFYIYCANNVFKVNTGSATLTDTIRLVVSSTEDGLFQTADIDDGATVTSFGGTTAGNGIINYSDIRWLGSSLSADIEGGKVDLGLDLIPLTTNTHDLGSSSLQFKDLYIDGIGYIDEARITTLKSDTITDQAGTDKPDFPNGLSISGDKWGIITDGGDDFIIRDVVNGLDKFEINDSSGDADAKIIGASAYTSRLWLVDDNNTTGAHYIESQYVSGTGTGASRDNNFRIFRSGSGAILTHDFSAGEWDIFGTAGTLRAHIGDNGVNVDTITNLAGTGAPKFTQGAGIDGANDKKLSFRPNVSNSEEIYTTSSSSDLNVLGRADLNIYIDRNDSSTTKELGVYKDGDESSGTQILRVHESEGLGVDEITDLAGTGAPRFPESVVLGTDGTSAGTRTRFLQYEGSISASSTTTFDVTIDSNAYFNAEFSSGSYYLSNGGCIKFVVGGYNFTPGFYASSTLYSSASSVSFSRVSNSTIRFTLTNPYGSGTMFYAVDIKVTDRTV